MVHRRISVVVAATVVIAGLASAGSASAKPTSSSTAAHGRLAALSPAVRAAVRRAAPRPPRVTHLAAYQDGAAVTLGWRDPNPALFARVIVRYARGGAAPSSPRSGTAVRLPAKASATTLGALRPNVKYAAAVWTRDSRGRLSPRDATTFIAPTVHRGGFATIAGTVTDNTGQPLSGAVVSGESWNSDFPSTASTVTGNDGSYRLTVPAGEDWIYIAASNAVGGAHDATGYLDDSRDITLSSGHHVTINSVVHPGAAMSGTVTDALGNPIGGVTVYGSPSYPYIPPDTGNAFAIFDYYYGAGTSRPDGTFTLKGLYPDVTQACFDPTTAGRLSSEPPNFGYFLQCEDTPYSVHVGHVTDTGATTLNVGPLGGALSGRVTSSTGQAVRGVFVTLTPSGRRFAVTGASTDSSGAYSISGLKAGTYRVCVRTSQSPTPNSALGYVSRCLTRRVTLAPGEAAHVHAVVYPGGAFSGVVRAPNGRPVPNASIWLVTPNSGSNVTVTDNRGRYIISGLRSGRYGACVDTASVPVRGYPNGLSSSCRRGKSRFGVRRGKLRIGVDFALRPGAAVRGTVTFGSGHPARWASVYTNTFNGEFADIGADGYAITGRNGHFKILGLQPGQYRLCYFNGSAAGEPRGRCPRRTVSARQSAVANYGTTSFGPSGAIHATVTDASGQLLNGVDVAALVPCHGFDCDKSPVFSAGRYKVAASWTTYGNGTVTLDDLRPGSYAVCLFGYLAAPRNGPTPVTGYADHCTSDAFDLTVQAHKITTVTATLPLAGAVTGTVTDSNGNPVPHVRVKVTNSAEADVSNDPFFFEISPPGQSAYTGADGTFAVRSVAAGNQTVCFDTANAKDRPGVESQCYGGQPGKKGGTPVPITAGAVTSGIDIALTRLGRIAGSISTSNGQPQPRRTEVFIFRPGHPRRALIGGPASDGSYRTPGLVPNAYVVCFDAPKYNGQCYDDVPWSGFDGSPLPSDATQVTVSPGATSSGIDAVLVHQ